MLRIILIAGLLAQTACANSQAAPPVEWGTETDSNEIRVMVVGTYHMAGSQSDLINPVIDSVLTERRQADLADVAASLATFAPTAVVTERVTAAPDYIDPYFADFTEATLLENPNERVQIAYRLARTAGITRVYGIDERPSADQPNYYFPFPTVAAHAAATGQKGKLDALLEATRAKVEQFMASTADDHIAARLLGMNRGPVAPPDFYYALSELDQGETQPAAELQAYWFMRNAKIWSKLMDVAKPGDSLVVVYGSGHKFWLDHMATHTPGYASVDPAPYLKKAAE